MNKIKYVSGSKDVLLTEAHQFTDWLRHDYDLAEWKKHFNKKKIKTAIGQNGYANYALFVRHKMLEG